MKNEINAIKMLVDAKKKQELENQKYYIKFAPILDFWKQVSELIVLESSKKMRVFEWRVQSAGKYLTHLELQKPSKKGTWTIFVDKDCKLYENDSVEGYTEEITEQQALEKLTEYILALHPILD